MAASEQQARAAGASTDAPAVCRCAAKACWHGWSAPGLELDRRNCCPCSPRAYGIDSRRQQHCRSIAPLYSLVHLHLCVCVA